MIIQNAQDDLNIILDEILNKKRPSERSLDQIEYQQELLEKQLASATIDEAHEIANILKTIEQVLRIYRTKKDELKSIKVTDENKIRLNKIDKTANMALSKILDFWEDNH